MVQKSDLTYPRPLSSGAGKPGMVSRAHLPAWDKPFSAHPPCTQEGREQALPTPQPASPLRAPSGHQTCVHIPHIAKSTYCAQLQEMPRCLEGQGESGRGRGCGSPAVFPMLSTPRRPMMTGGMPGPCTGMDTPGQLLVQSHPDPP